MTIPPFFPHASVRSGQDTFIDDLDQALTQKKILLAHAPTGLGKTASALAVAVEQALRSKKKVIFLTNRHTQHRLAIDTLALMRAKTGKDIITADLIGKRWMCSQDVAGLFGNEFNEFCKAVVEKGECEFYTTVRDKKTLSVEGKAALASLKQQPPRHTEEICAFAKEKTMCGYELAIALAKDAQVIVCDYFYIFNPNIQNSFLAKLEVELEDLILIVDEGHNLPSRIMDMLSSTLTSTMLRNTIIEAKKYGYVGVINWLQEILQILNGIAVFPSSSADLEIKISKDQFQKAIQTKVNYDALIDELEMAADEIRKKQRKSFCGSVASFLQAWKGEDEGFARILSESPGKNGPVISLRYLCLDSSLITRPIFARIHAGVVMSGTLKPLSMYKDVLGVPHALEKEYASPFPLANRVTLIIPETSTKFTTRSDLMFQAIAGRCSNLARLIPGNIAFFFPSYDLRDKIASFIQTSKQKFWEKREMVKEEKEQLLASFYAERRLGGVLLGVTGANFAEGVDFPGDLLNGVVVVGLPLAKPDLLTKELIAYYDRKFGKGWDYGYIYPAMNKCFQSAGRCIRSETDRGAIVFLDERFAWHNYFSCFPREGLRVTKEYESILQEFFRR
ncbi:ATP-dependent DNA helicase [Candidatus Woesearchaeota archaeon]|nr:ATP-dependent DNA helicase [Candidatus Woesearchaeota archaeon]